MTDDPAATDDPATTDGADGVRRSARVVLAVGVLAGLVSAPSLWAFRPDQVGLAAEVYYHAARTALAGGDFYAVAPPHLPGYRFLYPPVVVLAFLPHALLGSESAALALQTVLNVAVGLATAGVLWRALGRHGVSRSRLDGGLLVAFALGSAYAAPMVVMGQVTLWLGLAIAVGLDALDRGREGTAGAAFALAALVKLFPAAIGLWLLRRRAWRAIGVATATGVAGLLAGLAVFGPDATAVYVGEVLPRRIGSQAFAGTPDPTRGHVTVRRQLAAALPVAPWLLTALSAAILAPPVLAIYRRVDSVERRMAAVLGTLVATLLFLPLEALYFSLLTYPLVVLLYRLPRGRARHLLVAGTLWTYALVEFQTVEIAVRFVPWEAVASTALAATRAVFTVVLPPTVGMWLLLAACLAVHYGDGGTASPATTPTD